GFIRYVVNLVKQHPATWGYYIGDEAPSSQLTSVESLASTVKALDPHHPTLYVSGEDARTLGQNIEPFAHVPDVLASDVYPIGVSRNPDSDPIQSVGAVARNLQTMAGARGRQMALVVQAFSWGQYPKETWVPNPRWPTRAEMRQMRDQAVVNARPQI